MKKNLLLWLLLLGAGLSSDAQPSGDYVKTLNSYVPGSPEAAQIIKYVDYPVDLFTGTPQISIPLYTGAGQGLSVPLSLSYHAGGGIKVNDMASATGLGWLLSAGGEITREIRGMADETGGGFFNKPYPISYYAYNTRPERVQDYKGDWVAAQHGALDLEPDIFYFSFGPYCGKFLYDDSLHTFVCLQEKNKLNITYTAAADQWSVVADDGSLYLFTNKEQSRSQQYYGASTAWSTPQTTSWKLSKICNADRTDSILFTYDYNTYNYYSGGSSFQYNIVTNYGQTPARNPVNSYAYNNITGITKLTGIKGRNFSVEFTDDAATRQDLDLQKPLGKIVIKDANNNVQDIYKFYYSYFVRSGLINLGPSAPLKALRLDSIAEFGNSESNPTPLTHAFSYNNAALPGRLSYAQDFWGYANANTNGGTLAPALYINNGTYAQFYDGADRTPDTIKQQAGLLQQIRLPTGGTVSYAYEPNSAAQSYPFALALQATQVSNLLQQFAPAYGPFAATYTSTFTVNQDADEALNSGQGGVIADISIFTNPALPVYTGTGNPAVDYTKVYFRLESSSGFSAIYQYGGAQNVHLPNGLYTMTAYAQPLNNDMSAVRTLTFNVSYKAYICPPGQTGPCKPNNYMGCGVRVRSITSRDPYANISHTRNFFYGEPETGASYGRFIGNPVTWYLETLQSQNSDGGTYLVRPGSNDMAGQGGARNSIVYQKVIEESADGATRIHTEHNYDCTQAPIYCTSWPFVPVMDNESARGNETLTEWKQGNAGVFTNAKARKQLFDADPYTRADANTHFKRAYVGIKCSSDSYFNGSNSIGEQYPAQNIQAYLVPACNRTYLTSDSTITYDLNNEARSTVQWHDYVYGDYNVQPLIVRSGNSDGTISVQKNYYASDRPDADAEFSAAPLASLCSQMVTANRITMPLATQQFKDGQQLSRQYTYAHFSGSLLLVDSLRQALFSNTLDNEISVLQYDAAANPLTIALRGSKYRKYIWQTSKSLPLATCVTAQPNATFAFTSFEYDGEYSWGNGRSNATAFAGSYSYNLSGGAVSWNQFATGSYGSDVYLWATAGTVTVNGSPMESTGRTKGSWTLYRKHITGAAFLTIAGSGNIDNLLVLPTGSQFQGNVYDSGNRIVAIMNDVFATGFFEYDAFGRLQNVRDEQGNILSSNAYQYQGAQ